MPTTPETQFADALAAVVRAARRVDEIHQLDVKAEELSGKGPRNMTANVVLRSMVAEMHQALVHLDALAIGEAIRAYEAGRLEATQVRHAPVEKVRQDSVAWWALETAHGHAPQEAHAAVLGKPLNAFLCGARYTAHKRITMGEPLRRCMACRDVVEPPKFSRDVVEWYGPSTLGPDELVHAVHKDDPDRDMVTKGGATLCGLRSGVWYFGAPRRVVPRPDAPHARQCRGCSDRIVYPAEYAATGGAGGVVTTSEGGAGR